MVWGFVSQLFISIQLSGILWTRCSCSLWAIDLDFILEWETTFPNILKNWFSWVIWLKKNNLKKYRLWFPVIVKANTFLVPHISFFQWSLFLVFKGSEISRTWKWTHLVLQASLHCWISWFILFSPFPVKFLSSLRKWDNLCLSAWTFSYPCPLPSSVQFSMIWP